MTDRVCRRSQQREQREQRVMTAELALAKHVSDLRDLAHNVAGLSDEWLDRAGTSDMRKLIQEYRQQAREALGSGQ